MGDAADDAMNQTNSLVQTIVKHPFRVHYSGLRCNASHQRALVVLINL